MRIVTRAQMAAIEADADSRGHTFARMMSLAGEAAAREALRLAPNALHAVIICGPGNNGGDGLVAARSLRRAHLGVRAVVWRRERDELLEMAIRAGVHCAVIQGDELTQHDARTISRWLEEADVVLDALLGTGVDRPLTGIPAELLRALAAERAGKSRGPTGVDGGPGGSGGVSDGVSTGVSDGADDSGGSGGSAVQGGRPRPRLVAVDLPSGLHADSGTADPLTVPADVTVSFGAPKLGQLTFPGARAVGTLVIDRIGIPAESVARAAPDAPRLITGDAVAAMLPRRRPDGHKGSFGALTVAGGSPSYTGAVALAAEAAYRAGAGLVTLAVPSALHAPLAARVPEAVFALLDDPCGPDGDAAVESFLQATAGGTALLLGPGWTTRDPAALLLDALLQAAAEAGSDRPATTSDKPAIGQVSAMPGSPARAGSGQAAWVLDADALNLLARRPAWPASLPAGCILTPHPGEMARLVATSPAAGWEDPAASGGAAPFADGPLRLPAARDHARAWGQTVVLKGAHTVVAHPDGRCGVLPFATSALATAGTGDVLAGLIAGLRATGLGSYAAAASGAWVHGLAGVMAGRRLGERAVIARDVLRALPRALRSA